VITILYLMYFENMLNYVCNFRTQVYVTWFPDCLTMVIYVIIGSPLSQVDSIRISLFARARFSFVTLVYSPSTFVLV